eukprot:g8048.t1
MSNLALKLRKLYDKTPTDSTSALDDDFENGTAGPGSSKRRKLDADLQLGDSGEKRLRMRADIPMLVPGQKISRKELAEEKKDGPEDDAQSDGTDAEGLEEQEEEADDEEEEATDADVLDEDESQLPEDASDSDEEQAASDENKDEDEQLSGAAPAEKRLKLKATANAGAATGDPGSSQSRFEAETVRRQVDFYKSLMKLRVLHLEPALKKVRESGDFPGDPHLAKELTSALQALQRATATPRTENFDDCVRVLEETRSGTQVQLQNAAFKVLDQSIPTQIDNAIADLNWKKKVHVKDQSTGELNETLYDDHDFYAAMLAEIVTGGGAAAASSDPRGANASKTKSAAGACAAARAGYDRRASKGRKIRYVPIEKLQNFMSGRTLAQDEPMSEQMVDQMMRSLFR